MKQPKWITHLLEQGRVAHSQVTSAAATRLLDELISLDIVRIQTHRSRRRVVLQEATQFQRWVSLKFPLPQTPPTQQVGRSRNIALRGASKSGPATHTIQPLLLKWFDPNPNCLWAKQSLKQGLVGFTSDKINTLNAPRCWHLLTVENWESFYSLTYPKIKTVIVAVYLGGNVSEVVLQALKQIKPSPLTALHFGDYDWAGLAIFQRLQAVFPAAKLYIPLQIEALFQGYGQRNLVEKQFATANLDLTNPACRPIIDLIRQYNAGLEQEIVPQPTEADFVKRH